MIYIDASRFNNTSKRTGVENYSFYLITELLKLKPAGICLISPKELDSKVKQITIPFPRLWTHIRLSWEIFRNKKIDNLFVPSHVLPIISPKNATITIHDVVFKYSPKSYSLASRLYLNWAAKFAVKHAKNIIVPSEATKNDLIEFYKANKNKITVIPLGFEPSKAKPDLNILKKNQLQAKKFFLYVGRLEYKKNTDTLIKAFKKFAATNKDIKLVLAGFPGHGGKEIIESIPSSLKDQVVLTGYISEEEKEALYQNALSFVFPSRHEGFGIPLLEAMHAKLPIIASDIPSSKELAKDVANFFNKENADELAKLMSDIASNKEKDEEKIANYKNTLSKYSWKQAAEKTMSIIDN